MKATTLTPATTLRPGRTRASLAASLAVTLATLLASCVSPPPPAPPGPPPTRPRAEAPPPAPPADWRDAPITPGTWRWTVEQGGPVAAFAGRSLVLQCRGGVVVLTREGASPGAAVRIVTTTQTRGGTIGADGLRIPARDPLLDAMAFSRGRFAVVVAGLPTLYVPSWPEVTRVVQDCR